MNGENSLWVAIKTDPVRPRYDEEWTAYLESLDVWQTVENYGNGSRHPIEFI